MRRLFDLPRIATTLRAMYEAGVLPLAESALEPLRNYGLRARRANFLGRLAVVIAGGDEAIQARWRLSNEEMGRARAIVGAARLLEDLRVHEAAYRYPEALEDAVDVATVLAGWTEAGKSAVLDQLQHVEVQPFPLGGADLIALGHAPGPGMGAELARLEQLWIDSGFAMDRAALLEAARR
jgi:poly(A) polymerase